MDSFVNLLKFKLTCITFIDFEGKIVYKNCL